MKNTQATSIARARAFTLVELLVAVGAVLLLSVGVGQIFKQVGKLVNTGSAAAEVDQLARALERQLSDDFRSLSRMLPEDTFIAIRGRWVGDTNGNGMLDSGERAVYLSAEDRETDVRSGIEPYENDSKAVTVRVDEICFLTDGQQYRTAQLDPLGGANVSSTAARIYYGHALRPHSEIDDNAGTDDLPTFIREFDPDGGFAQRAGETNDYASDQVTDDARNEYAGDFLLVRQPVLLAGSVASGYQGNNPPPPFIGTQRAYAPYLRDREIELRFAMDNDTPEKSSAQVGGASINPDLRLIRHGRVDICAMSIAEIRRWIEGQDPASANGVSRDATPYRAPGAWDGDPTYDFPLWQRFVYTGNAGATRRTIAENNAILRGAIAGCVTRILADNQLPTINRVREDSDTDPEDALMDLHAVIATRCSSFEVAWTDGTTWLNASNPLLLRRGDGGLAEPAADEFEADAIYRYGDIVWFDAFMPRSYYLLNYSQPSLAAPFPDNEVVDVNGLIDTLASTNANTPGAYDQVATGGWPDEYLSVWPFREIDGGGNIGRPWTKPRMIRIRLTLHDNAVRIEGGKTFEFIFNIGQES